MRKVLDSSASEDFLGDRLRARSYSSRHKQADGQQFVHRSRHISSKGIQPFSTAANEWRSVAQKKLEVIYFHEGGSGSTGIWRKSRETRVRTCSALLRGKKEQTRDLKPSEIPPSLDPGELVSLQKLHSAFLFFMLSQIILKCINLFTNIQIPKSSHLSISMPFAALSGWFLTTSHPLVLNDRKTKH